MSENNLDFETAGWVEGKGTTNEKNTYSFKINNIFSSQYFRLKQVDYDGKFEYLPTTFVPITTNPEINIYPNPTTENIHISGDLGAIYNASMIDPTGHKIISLETTNLDLFEDKLNEIINDLKSGIYFINLNTSAGLISKRISLK